MKKTKMMLLTGSFFLGLLFIGCGGSPAVIDKESSTSSIRAAEEVGATGISSAALYLQLAKEELGKAEVFAADGDKKQADSMLLRASVDGELAVALSKSDTDKKEAADAMDRVKKLRQDNNISEERN